jgi:hypothetical protein
MSLGSQSSSNPDLRGPLLTLRIIVFALAAGVSAFAAFVISQNLGKPHVVAGKLDAAGMVFVVFGLMAIPLGIVVPRIIFAAGRGAKPINLPAGIPPEQAGTWMILQRIQTSTIIGCAIFEGAAFANVFGYMQSRDLVYLALAGVLLVGILAHFPSMGSFERRIEDEQRRINENEALGRLRG